MFTVRTRLPAAPKWVIKQDGILGRPPRKGHSISISVLNVEVESSVDWDDLTEQSERAVVFVRSSRVDGPLVVDARYFRGVLPNTPSGNQPE